MPVDPEELNEIDAAFLSTIDFQRIWKGDAKRCVLDVAERLKSTKHR